MHGSLVGVHCLVHFSWLSCHWQKCRCRDWMGRPRCKTLKANIDVSEPSQFCNHKKHECCAFPLSELKLTADRQSHYCTKSCLLISMYLYKSGIPVSWREQVTLYRLATVTYNNQGQTRLADSAWTRKHCCYSFCWSQELGSANSCFIIRFTRQMVFVLDTLKLFHMLTVWRKQ